ncbi:MAG: trypsin-like peptidase domain-containing protein [Clostridiales bacterium]|nr:trypsin-like peptidase domain-containing protein [Clostridiales bacterium]
MKKLLTAAVCAISALTIGICGCFMSAGLNGADGVDGKDGKDGQNATAFDYYELAKTVPGQENMTVEEFLQKYLSYTKEELEEEFAPQRNANRSLLSAVSILAGFKCNTTYRGNPVTYNAVYSGAGVIVDIDKEKGDAYVITNCHVVYDDAAINPICTDVRLYLYGQDTRGVNYKISSKVIKTPSALSDGIYDTTVFGDEDYCINARVVSASVANDIALLKVTGSEVLKNSSAIAAEFEESDDVYVKEDVYAIGNPEGDGMNVTSGTITKESQIIQLNLSDEHAGSEDYFLDYRVIGTDTAINGGNSGGGLFSSKTGKLVGIVNSKNVADDIDNMGFALPGNIVKRLWKLMRDNFEGRGGGSYATTTGVDCVVFPATCAAKSTGAYWDNEKNVAVIEEKVTVTSNKTLSEGNEFKINDVVTHIKISGGDGTVYEDRDVTRVYHLNDTLISARMGDTIEITVRRGGEKVVVTYTATPSRVK